MVQGSELPGTSRAGMDSGERQFFWHTHVQFSITAYGLDADTALPAGESLEKTQ